MPGYSGTIQFIECTSLNISYDVFGVATVTYTVVHNYPGIVAFNSVTAGGRTFAGYVTNVSVSPIPRSPGWYESTITLISTTN